MRITEHMSTCSDVQIWHRPTAARRATSVAALAETFKAPRRRRPASAFSTRSRAVRALRRRHRRSCSGSSESAVSHQLRLLRGMRLVRPRRAGQHDLLLPRRPAHRRPVRAGARARPGARGVARRASRCGEARVPDLHRLRAARRVDLQGRGHGLPRRGGAHRAALQEPARASRPSRPTSWASGSTSSTTRRSCRPSAIAAAVADAGHARLARARGAGRHRRARRGRGRCCSAASGAALAAGLLAECARRATLGCRSRCLRLSLAAGVPLTVAEGLASRCACARSTSTC